MPMCTEESGKTHTTLFTVIASGEGAEVEEEGLLAPPKTPSLLRSIPLQVYSNHLYLHRIMW